MQAIIALKEMAPAGVNPVFRARHNGVARLENTTMRLRLRRLLVAAGVPHLEYLSLHSLRRGGATVALQKGRDLRFIMAQGRWRSDCIRMYL